MDQQPSMQDAVIASLLIEFALFLADVLEIIDGRVQVGRKQHAQLLKHGLRSSAISQTASTRSTLGEIRLHLAAKEVLELRAGFFIDLQTGGDCEAAHGASAGRGRELLLGGLGNITLQGGDSFADQGGSFIDELNTDTADLLVDGFKGNALRGKARHKVLQDCANDAADEDHREEPHQAARQTDTETKARMEEDERVADEAEPEMAAHPGLRASDPPDGNFLASTE